MQQVKQLEKRPRETLLSAEFCAALAYVNAILPPSQQLRYHAYDLRRAAKQRNTDVLMDLQSVMKDTVEAVGAFVYVPPIQKVCWLCVDGVWVCAGVVVLHVVLRGLYV